MIEINKELKEIIPPLTNEEFKGLETDIKKDGCRDSLILWKGKDTIVDGHNRYKICSENNIPFKTVEKEFADINDVKLWMINNQKSRRNLTDGWKFELAQTKKAILLEKGKANISANKGGTSTLSNVDKEAHNTRNVMASDLGWSTGKVAMADKVWNKANEEVKKEIKEGNKSINEVYKEITKDEKIAARNEKIAQQTLKIEQENLEQPTGDFDIIVVDPPWKVDFDYKPDHYMGRVANPYPEMNVEQIKNIKLPSKEDSILWLWTTHSQIWGAIEILKHWGYEYKGILTWNKESMGIGKWLRKQCEFCLLGIKGQPIWTATDVRDIITEQRTSHSTKPESFYKMVEDNCVGRKLDYFARKKREGWEVYGTMEDKND